MKTLIAIACAAASVALTGCGSDDYKELEAFDSSLDSLVVKPVVYSRSFTLYEGDTLKGNPREVLDTYYRRAQVDSPWVFAQFVKLGFQDRNLVRSELRTAEGDTVVLKFIHYSENIDNEDFFSQRRHYAAGDSTVRAYCSWYDRTGNLVKLVEVGQSKARDLKVFRYDSINRLQRRWQRSHYPAELADTLWKKRIVRTEYKYVDGFSLPATRTFVTTGTTDSTAARNPRAWQYEYDERGNWTRRLRDDSLHAVERKIHY